jgi:hypothetical protein
MSDQDQTRSPGPAAGDAPQDAPQGAPQNCPPPDWLVRPQGEHAWLQRLVGDWECDAPPPPPGVALPPDAPSTLVTTYRTLDGVWLVGESAMPSPDGTMGHTLMTVGFDPARGRFVGTWIGSMMTHLWVYDGELDPDGRTLLLYADGPDMAGTGAMVQYCDSIEFVEADRHVFRGSLRDENGGWKPFMELEFRRRR